MRHEQHAREKCYTHPPEPLLLAPFLNQSNHAYDRPAIALWHSDTPTKLSRIAPSFCDKAHHFRLSAAVVPRLTTTTTLPTTCDFTTLRERQAGALSGP
jgi:hypothetical protein